MPLDFDKCRRTRQRLVPERVRNWTPLEQLAVDTHLKYCGACASYWLRVRGGAASLVPEVARGRLLLAPGGVEMGHASPARASNLARSTPVRHVLATRQTAEPARRTTEWPAQVGAALLLAMAAALAALLLVLVLPSH